MGFISFSFVSWMQECRKCIISFYGRSHPCSNFLFFLLLFLLNLISILEMLIFYFETWFKAWIVCCMYFRYFQETKICKQCHLQHTCILLTNYYMQVQYVMIIKQFTVMRLFSPLMFRSESPSQVFLIILSFLYLLFQDVAESEFKNFWLAYDNMCNVMRLKAAKVHLSS